MDFLSSLIPVFVMSAGPAIVGAVKKYGVKVPKILMPVAAAAVTAAAGYFTDLSAGWTGALALAGIGGREILDQVKKAVSEL